MTDFLFTLYCEDCEAGGLPSRLWVRAEIEVSSLSSPSSAAQSGADAPETEHYLECMNCGFRFKSCMEDHMEAVGEEEWNRFVDESVAVVDATVGDASDSTATPTS